MPDRPLEVRWLKRALANLDAEAAFIARDSPAAAARLVDTIARTVELLAQHPGLGRAGRVEGSRVNAAPSVSIVDDDRGEWLFHRGGADKYTGVQPLSHGSEGGRGSENAIVAAHLIRSTRCGARSASPKGAGLRKQARPTIAA